MRSEEWWNGRTTYKAPQYPFLYGKQLTVSSRQIKYLFTANYKIGEHIETNSVLYEYIHIRVIRCARRLHSSFLTPHCI